MTFVKEIEVLRMTARFNLRAVKKCKDYTRLYYVVNYAGKQIKLPTTIKIKPNHWNNKGQCCLISSALTEVENIYNAKINKEIDRLKFAFIECKEYICANPKEMDFVKEHLYNYCTNIHKEMAKKENAITELYKLVENAAIGNQTKNIYKSELDDFKEFVKNKKGNIIISWDEINEKLIRDYKKYLQTKKVIHKITKEEVYEKDATIKDKLSRIGAILNYAYEEELISKIDVTKIKKTKSSKNDDSDFHIALSEDEINRLYNLELKGKEEKTRDLFIFQLLTGQRYETINGIELDKDNPIIIQEKGNKSIPIKPLIEKDKKLQNICNKYNYKLPKIARQTTNKHLKEFGKQIQLNEKVPCSELRGGELYKYVVEKWELLATHTARRTFVTNAVLNGINETLTMSVTGHSAREMNDRYTKIKRKTGVNKFAEKMYHNEEESDNNDDINALVDKLSKTLSERKDNVKIEVVEKSEYEYIENHIKELFKCDYPLNDEINCKANNIHYNGITEGTKHYNKMLEEMHNNTMHILMNLIDKPQIIGKYYNDVVNAISEFEYHYLPNEEYKQSILREYKKPRTTAQEYDIRLTEYIIDMSGIQRIYQNKLKENIESLLK